MGEDQVIRTEYDVPLAPQPNQVSVVLTDRLPPAHLITSALALIFVDGKLLLTQLRSRGWDIPGGHCEPGETPEQTVRREVFEETGATLGEVRVLGYQHFRLVGAAPSGYRYPHPDSYQVFFMGEEADLADFQDTAESSRRGLFDPPAVAALHWPETNWALHELYVAARRLLRRDRVPLEQKREYDPRADL